MNAQTAKWEPGGKLAMPRAYDTPQLFREDTILRPVVFTAFVSPYDVH